MDLRPVGPLLEFLEPPAELQAHELAPLLVRWWLELHEPFLVLLKALLQHGEAPGVWAEALLRRLDWWDSSPQVYELVARDLERIAEPRMRQWAATLPAVRRHCGETVVPRTLPDPLPPAGTLAGLQARLDKLGWADLEVTGELDAPTRLALECLQHDRTDPATVDAQTFQSFLLPEEYEE